MKMKTLDRIHQAKTAWDGLMLVLEVADFVTSGSVRRALRDVARPKTFENKRPADYVIKVKSSRE